MVDLARQNWRDYEVDGVAASGKYKPKKSKLRQWGTWVEGIITSFTSNGGLIYTTRALLYADLAYDANASAWVVSDSTGAYNGIYQKSGASGGGAWTRVADLPYSFISCTDAGAGTANAIIATSSIPAPSTAGMALFVSNVYEANTGAVTYALNGAAAKPVITNSGNALSSGYLTAGMHVLFFDDGTNYRLLSDVASAAIQAAAEAAVADAEAAAANAIPLISVLTVDFTGSDAGTAQPVFSAAQDTLTVQALTTYRFRAEYVITRAAGTTSHTTGILFGGTATFTSIDGVARASNPTGNVLGAPNDIQITAATETVVTAANTSATENVRITLDGVMRINGAGTIIPQFKFSAAPGGAPTIKRNSFFECWPIGSNTVATVGGWA